MGFPWTEQLTQSLTVAAAGISPVSESAGTYLTSAVDLKKFRKVLFVLNVGVISSGGTLSAQVQAATTSGGTYSNVSGTSITQLTQAGGNGNQTVLVEVSADHLQNTMGNGYEFLKLQVVVGTAASLVNVTVLGAIGDHEPTSGNADASLLQTVVL
ncbi:MAG: hypothetical protein P4L84_33650 [Isosphaeraceae bacterium]|nr:hypothetical protein [Isosphaeraceae bacterium]